MKNAMKVFRSNFVDEKIPKSIVDFAFLNSELLNSVSKKSFFLQVMRQNLN